MGRLSLLPGLHGHRAAEPEPKHRRPGPRAHTPSRWAPELVAPKPDSGVRAGGLFPATLRN